MATESVPLRHFLLGEQFRGAESYTSKKRVISDPVPQRDRQSHGARLQAELHQIEVAYLLQDEPVDESYIRSKGLIIEIEVPASFSEETTDLDRSDRLQLLNQRPFINEEGAEWIRQTWFVPDGHLSVLADIFDAYLTRESRFNKPKYYSLVNSVESLRAGALEQLWTEIEPLPADDEDRWWEVWLRAGGAGVDRDEIEAQFRGEAARVGLRVGEQRILLPEHTIVAVRGRVAAFRSSSALLNCLTELRLGRDFAGDYDAMPVEALRAFAADLRERLDTSRP